MLAVTTKYALSCLIHLARHSHGEFMQVKELSKQAEIPGPYLSKIVKGLASKGIVDTKKGKHGGVRFPAQGKKTQVSFYDVCLALEDPVVAQRCLLSKGQCLAGEPCAIHFKWRAAQSDFLKFLKQSKV